MMIQKRQLLVLALSLGAATAFAAATLDQPAPAFTATTADGRSVDLASLRGKTVVLEWTNHDCPYVKKHYDSGNIPAQQKEAAAQGVVWLQVISSAPGQQGFVDGATAAKLNASRNAQRRTLGHFAGPDRRHRQGLRRADHAASLHHHADGSAGLQGRHRQHCHGQEGRHRQGRALREAGPGRPRGGPQGGTGEHAALWLLGQVLKLIKPSDAS